MKLSLIISFLVFSSIESIYGQNAYVKLGQQAFMDGDFKSAISQLERACAVDSTDANALWMLGYSYYHSDNYKKSITAFTRAISLKPTDQMAYYYRARAKSYLGKDNSLLLAEREKYLLGAIFDFTRAIEINPDPNDVKFYQNRGIAYRDYGTFKLQYITRTTDKARGINSLKAAIVDLQKVLDMDPSRSDISTLIDQSKVQLSAATDHH
jgi:tetratricopeptide (TPR) repeat protein